MSINTKSNNNSPKKLVTETPQDSKDSGLSFLKKKWKLYFVIFLGIYFLGRIVSSSARGEVLSQSGRNMLSAGLLFILLIVGLVNAHLIYLIIILYIPFVDALPGRFGGEHTALNLVNVLLAIMLLCWFVDSVKKNRTFLIVNKASKFAIMFIVFSCLSYIVNGFGYGTNYLINQVFNLKRWADPVLLFLIVSSMVYRKDLRRDTIIALLLGVAMVIFLAIKDVSQITHFSEDRRIAGVGEQPNLLGAFVVDYMFLFLGILLVNSRKKIYWLATIPFWWGVKTVMVSFSRGAYVAFIVATLFITFIKNKALFIMCIAIFLFISQNLWVLPHAVRERIEMTITGKQLYGYGVEIEYSAERRVEAWKATLDLIRNKPFLGYGSGMVGMYLYYYSRIGMADVHNSYLLIAAEYGLLTLAAFLCCLFAGLRAAWFVYKNSKDDIIKGTALGFVAGIVGLMVNCFFGSHMTTLWEIGYFWVLLAIFANEEKDLRSEMVAVRSK